MFFAVIDERQKESLPEHENRLSSIRWHLSEGMYETLCFRKHARVFVFIMWKYVSL